MGFKRVSIAIVVIATLAIIAPMIYYQIDQREFNRRTTAEQAAKNNSFRGKTVIVTGSSAGIGIPTAKVLYENGATVIMAVRNPKKGDRVRKEILSSIGHSENNTLNSDNLIVMKCDLGSLKSVQSFCSQFISNYKKLNILINNAGIMGNDEFGLTVDGIEQQFGVNNIGHFHLTQTLTPLLIESAKKNEISRVLNLASYAYFFAPRNLKQYFVNEDKINDPSAYSPMFRYGLTKAANIIFAKEYNTRYASSNVYSVSIHPGSIKTGLQRYNFWLGLWNKVTPNVYVKSPSQGAATTIRAAAMSDAEFREHGGKYFEDCNVAALGRSDVIDDGENSDEIGRLYWELSEKMIKSRI